MTRKTIFVPFHGHDAGKWIYQGFYNAWESLGYDTKWYTNIQIEELPKNSYIMAVDSPEIDYKELVKFEKVFLYCRNNTLPGLYGVHANFVCDLPRDLIEELNVYNNVIKFNFGKCLPQYMNIWRSVHYLPLAFDDISYKQYENEFKYDVSFIGGFANNGYNTKINIMKEKLAPFQGSKLKCLFQIGKNISHEAENKILCNSKICLNIHDSYQHELGLDTNERTFKALGTCGIVVSDDVKCLKEEPLKNIRTFFRVMPEVCEEILAKKNLEDIRKHNKSEIMKNHTYKSRVLEMKGWL